MRDEVHKRVREYVIESWLNGDGRGFDDDTDMQRMGILDSFSTLALVSFLEETFKIQIEPIEVNGETFRSLRAIGQLILDKLAPASAAAKFAGP
jgi:acyl carrier protein